MVLDMSFLSTLDTILTHIFNLIAFFGFILQEFTIFTLSKRRRLAIFMVENFTDPMSAA